MDRYNPFEKLSDLYDSIVDWQSDPLIKPENQNKYLFSDGKTYYEELCKILKLLSTFKDGFNQIYDDLDELEEQIHQSGVTQEELDQAINNLHTIITGEIALVESSLSSDISDLDTEVTSLSGRMTTAESNIGALQTLTATHSTDIATINTAITSIQASLLTKISDAPSDGKTYGRKNGTWTEVTGGGGGGTSDYDALDNKPQINGNILTGNKTGTQLGLVDTSTLSNYVAKTDAPGYNDILTQSNAQLIYQTIQAMSSYLQKTDAPGYADILTKTDASSLYQTILGMNSYLLKADAPGYADILTQTSASSLYQTISGMSAYLTTSDASSTYTPLNNNVVASALLQLLATSTSPTPMLLGRVSSGVSFLYPIEDSTNNLPTIRLSGYEYTSSGRNSVTEYVYFSDEFVIASEDVSNPTRIDLAHKILSGTSEPSSALGNNGDIYIKYDAS